MSLVMVSVKMGFPQREWHRVSIRMMDSESTARLFSSNTLICGMLDLSLGEVTGL